MAKWSTVNPFTHPDEFHQLRTERKQAIVDQLASCTALEAKTNHLTFIFHPSTKEAGSYQLTYFDQLGPLSDIQRRTLGEIAEELIHTDYEVLAVI